jgi:WXG100 family type VII secretion target
LRVDPAVLATTCSSLSAAAEHLLSELRTLDSQVETLLANWRGQSGGTYKEAYVMWSKGADEVEKGLAIMADLLGHAGRRYAEQDAAAREQLDGLHG